MPPKSDQPSFALQVQLLPTEGDRTLVLAHAAGIRNGDHRFSPGEVDRLARQLRLPPISNVSNVLARLRSARLAVSEGAGRWALTPTGDQKAENLVAGIDLGRLDTVTSAVAGAVFAEAEHKVVPPEFAPPRWAQGIARMLERFPFDTNVFCMTRFPSDGEDVADPVASVIEVARDVLADLGLTLHLASDRQFEDDLLGNVGAYTWACKYGLGLIETRLNADLNYNAVIELGSMIITGRRCTMLRDVGAPNLPTDLSGQIYKTVDFDDLATVRSMVRAWVTEDLGLS